MNLVFYLVDDIAFHRDQQANILFTLLSELRHPHNGKYQF